MSPSTPRGALRAGQLAALLLAGLAAGPARAIDAPDAPGPWAVGHTTDAVFEPAACSCGCSGSHLPPGTWMDFDIWYPVDAPDWVGSFTQYVLFTIPLNPPFAITSTHAKEGADVSDTGSRELIVFSHGSGSVAYQSVKLVETLASHGFIVVAPTHDGNWFFDNGKPVAEVARQRPRDVCFTIDHVLARNADGGDAFFGKIDPDRIGVSGHSFGGFTAMATASGYDDGVESIPKDPRVKAIYPVSPAHGFLEDDEIRAIGVPTCYMDGSLEPSSTTAERPFDVMTKRAPFHCRSQVIGATHTHFANICDIGQALIDRGFCPSTSDPLPNPPCDIIPTVASGYTAWNVFGSGLAQPYIDTCLPSALDLDLVIRLQNLYAVAFFRRFLRQEAAYDPYLTAAYADTEPLINFFLEFLASVPALSAAGALLLCGTLAGAALLGMRRRRTHGGG